VKRRVRAGLAAAALAMVAPVVAAQPASASSSTMVTSAALTFVDGNGTTVTCTVQDSAKHNTDNPNQPTTSVDSGESGDFNDCIDFVVLISTISYKDRGGVRRTVTSSGFATGNLTAQGTYSAISTSVTAEYFNCDSSRSATCKVTAVANPK
jgi:hypothetical protein